MQVVRTDPVLERVDEIAVYIAQDDPDAAVRELIFGSYRVFYRVGSASTQQRNVRFYTWGLGSILN